MPILKEEDREYLQKLFSEKLHNEIKILMFTQKLECEYCQPTEEMLQEVASLSPKIKLEIHNFIEEKEVAERYGVDKIPAILLLGIDDKDYGIRFFGIPSGYEFSSLVEDIVDVSKGTTDLTPETKEKIKKIDKPIHIKVFVTPTCPYCPAAVRLAHKLAIENDNIRSDMIESIEFPHLANKYGVYGVPKVIINEETEFEGALPESTFVSFVEEAYKKIKE